MCYKERNLSFSTLYDVWGDDFRKNFQFLEKRNFILLYKLNFLVLLQLHKTLKGSRNIQGFALIRAVLLSFMLFRKITFLGLLDELKMHQLSELITIRMSKHMVSISCKGATKYQRCNKTRGPAESWRDLFDYFNIDYFKNVLKFQVSQVDSALPTQKKWKRSLCIHW